MKKHRFAKRMTACCLALVLLTACLPLGAAAQDEQTVFTGNVLAVINTNRKNIYAAFSTDREPTEEMVEAAAEPQADADVMLKDAPIEEPEPLSGAEALLRQAQVGDVEPQAAACYRVGDTKTIYSHYAVSEGKNYRRVNMVCTVVSETATIWRERGTEEDHAEYDAKLAAELDERLPLEVEFFGDRRIDTDGDGKIAVLFYEIDGENIGGYFTVVDLMDRVGRVGSVWHPYFSTSNHMDCIHVQGHSSYSFGMETCLHEYQHYIQASYRFVGKNNFNYLKATETFINEGFSTGAEFLLAGSDDYSYGFAYASRPSRGLSFLNWKHDNGNYSMAFVFSQYVRTRYAVLTDDLDSDIPGGTIFKKILESRTPKNDKDTMALIADILYPEADYPQLRDPEARCRQLLVDFWLAVFCKEPEGVHGFNGESWATRIDVQDLLLEMPAGETEYPIRSGMAAFYRIAENDTNTVRITESDARLTFLVPQTQGYALRFDANGGQDAPQAMILFGATRFYGMPSRSGYTFMGWALTPDASAPKYNSGNRITLTEDTTLYAVWQQAPTVVTGTPYSMRGQGREYRNNYVFVPQTDGIYKLTFNSDYTRWMFVLLDGEEAESLCCIYAGYTVSAYYSLKGGTAYDLRLQAEQTLAGSGTFSVTRQDAYYSLTYRFDHPLVDETWSYTGETVYTVEEYEYYTYPVFIGWAYTPDAQTPDVLPGETITLTQDTTLYAVCVPDVPLPTDGTAARAAVTQGSFLYILQPQKDGMYALQWQPENAPEGEEEYGYEAELLDAHGKILRILKPGETASCAMGAGETYYLVGTSDSAFVTASCKQTSNRITCSLQFSVGKKACFDLKLCGKATYTIPDYTPTALDGRTFAFWRNDDTWDTYEPGDTITVSADTVLTAVWKDAPVIRSEYVRVMLHMPMQVVRTLWQNLLLRITDRFTR